jgi:hypothetical protein
MKKLLLVATVFLGGAVAGCGASPCDKLQDICNSCQDSTLKASCNSTVRSYKALPTGDTSCQAVIDAHTYDGC